MTAQAEIKTERASMEDRLEAFLNRVSDWLKYEEAKNAALVTLNGVGVGVVLQSMTGAGRLHALVLSGCLLLFLASLLIGLVSFYPMLNTDRLHQRFTNRRRAEPSRKPNVVFFHDIVGISDDGFLAALRSAANSNESPSHTTDLEKNYASEIIANAELTLWKIALFKAAFVVTVVGVVALGVAFLVDRLSATIAR